MGDFLSDGERAASSWRLAVRVATGDPSPLRTRVAGETLLVFHARRAAQAGEAATPQALVACVVDERCRACGGSRADAGAWQVREPAAVRCPACGAVEAVGGDDPAWPVMCVDDEVYVHVDDG